MKIVSIIKRNPPLTLEFNDAAPYQFTVDEDGEHVCEITNEAHIARLLSIPEGFREYGKPVELIQAQAAPAVVLSQDGIIPPDLAVPVAASMDDMLGVDEFPPLFELGHGVTLERGEVMAAVLLLSGKTLEEWNQQDEAQAVALVEAYLDERQASVDAEHAQPNPDAPPPAGEPGVNNEQEDGARKDAQQPPEPTDDEREQAVAAYVEKFGKKPHGKWTAEKINAALTAPAE